MNDLNSGLIKVNNIKQRNMSVYDHIDIGDSKYWLTSNELTAVLNAKLVGLSFAGLPIRTRSKRVKEKIAEALGYIVPKTFIKCQPRFTGQLFDTYVQKSNNLQIWNEELDVERRYVIIQTNELDEITVIKVISGSDLAELDTTGTLTQKFQASLTYIVEPYQLISPIDTNNLQPKINTSNPDLSNQCPISDPDNLILPISECFDRLKKIVGSKFIDAGAIQERNRGAALHALVCDALGYKDYKDNGKFPDIRHQLIEVKLQTSPTIDLGLVCPNSTAVLDIEKIQGTQIRHCDVRYAIFYGHIKDNMVHITSLYMTTGEMFFTRFKQFGGNVLNKKIQIRLPQNFFN